MELGIGPEKLVLLTSKFVKLLCGEKFGNEPETLKLYPISTIVRFLRWKVLVGNRPSRALWVSRRTLREDKSPKNSGTGPYKLLYCRLISVNERMTESDPQIGPWRKQRGKLRT